MEYPKVPDKSENHQSNEQRMHGTISPEAVLPSQQHTLQNNDDEIDLADLWRAIWAGKFLIIAISFIFAVGSIAFAISKSDVYKASVLLSPASSGSAGGIGALAGQFGGLASLAGISLGAGGADKTDLALEIIKSRAFLEGFIAKHEMLVPLMASKSWDRVKNKLVINDEIYDISANKWLGKVDAANNPAPSEWRAYQAFLGRLSVSKNNITSLVTITLEFYSPDIAKQWLIWLVTDVNNFMREKDEKEAQASIDYLTNQLEQTEISAMETVFYQLIEEQTKNMMLTKVSPEYVLKTIDPAQVPERKAGPKRALIVVLGTIFGGILSVLIVLIRCFTKSSKSTKTKEDILA